MKDLSKKKWAAQAAHRECESLNPALRVRGKSHSSARIFFTDKTEKNLIFFKIFLTN